MNPKLITTALFIVMLISSCIPKKYADTEKFNELNKCQSDSECTVGQWNAGPDLASPSPKCMAKKAIEASNPNY